MARYDYDLAIIGGGAAGLTVAAGAAQLGVKTILAEREPELGGDCLHYGCVPSKTLIKSARVYHQMQDGPRYGLPRVDLPPVDFARVAERIREVIAAIQPHDSEERFCRLGAKVVFGQARFLDEHVLDLGGARVSARRILIATGSEPATPPIPGLDSVPFLTNKDIFSLDRLPPSMLILGAGPIALEMAQSFARFGTRVTVVQRSGQVLSREDKDMADTVMAALEEENVRILLDTQVSSVRKGGEGIELAVDGNGGERVLTAEVLLVALGRTPCVSGLDLDAAGVEHSGRGVAVDRRMRTSRKHIFAAGDVTGDWQFTHAAGYEGGIVIANAVFHLPRKANYANLPWCTYTEPELASIGLNEKRAQEKGLERDKDFTVWTEDFEDNDRARAEAETRGMIKMLVDSGGRPLGVQIAGPQAGELINEWVAVMGGRVKLSTMASAVHPYPTLGEINKRVAGKLLSAKLFSDRVRKILRFFFGFQGRGCSLDD